MAEQNLKDKTVKGTMWSGIDNVVRLGIYFIVSIVLARLLTPDDYGLIGIIMIFTTVCDTLINAGFSDALIRKKDATEDDYNTVFIVNLMTSIVLYAVVFASAPLISSFFGRTELVALVRVMTLVMIIGALAKVQQTRLTKRIDFKTQTKVTLASSIISGVVGIGMALLDFGVWSLVAQQLAAQALRTVLLWFYNKWVPRLKFSMQSFHELFGFGWKLMASTLLDSLWKELYQVVVGKFYSPATLGQYTRAKQFSSLLTSNLTGIIQRVTYPVLADIQDEKERMLTAYRRIIKVTMFVTVICTFLLGAISEPLIYCLIGPKWLEASTYLPLICISGSLYPLHALNLNMLGVQGRGGYILGLEVIKKIIALGPLFIGAFVGIMPMLYTNLITGIVAFFLNSHYSGKLLGYSSWMQIKDIAPSYCIATIVAVLVYTMKFIPITYWAILPLQILLGIILIFIICETAKTSEYKEVKGMAMAVFQKIRSLNRK